MNILHRWLTVFFFGVGCIGGLGAQEEAPKKTALLIVATGVYTQWVQPLIDSADTYFLPNGEVTYVVFTDSQDYLSGQAQFNSQKRAIKVLYHPRLGWPRDTMMRPSAYYKYREEYADMDYLFALDSDMLFVDTVGDEILGDRVGTQHPGYVGRRGTYETRRNSTAYVGRSEGRHYFAGGFNGGSREEYLKLCKTVTENVEADLENNIIAVWHDESHINRYFVDNPPTVVLSPEYCYPGFNPPDHYKRIWPVQYKMKLVALDKDHAAARK